MVLLFLVKWLFYILLQMWEKLLNESQLSAWPFSDVYPNFYQRLPDSIKHMQKIDLKNNYAIFGQ